MQKISLLIAILSLFSGAYLEIDDYYNGGDELLIAQYEKMLRDGSIAPLRSKESSILLYNLDSAYIFKYEFVVKDKIYKGQNIASYRMDKISKAYYLEENPGLNTIDPQAEIKKEKEKRYVKSNLYIGLFLAVLGLLGLVQFFYELLK